MKTERHTLFFSSVEKYFTSKSLNLSNLKVIAQWTLLLILVIASSAFSLFMPALFVFLWLMFVSFLPKNPNITIAISTVNVIFILSWMNMEKIPVNDWSWYTTHYRWLEEMPLSNYIGNRFNGMTIKTTEPVYHTLSALISRISNGSISVLAWVVTAIIYGSVSIGIALLTRGHLKSAYEAILITWLPLSVGITFTLTTQLVRQEIASSMLFLGIAMLWVKRKKTGWLS